MDSEEPYNDELDNHLWVFQPEKSPDRLDGWLVDGNCRNEVPGINAATNSSVFDSSFFCDLNVTNNKKQFEVIRRREKMERNEKRL